MTISAVSDYDDDLTKSNFEVTPWTQITVIVSVQAMIVFASAAGIIPIGFLVTSIGSVCVLAFNAFGITALEHLLGRKEEEESQYDTALKNMSPVTIAVIGPFIEEVLFRGIFQGGLQLGLKCLIGRITVSILGAQFSVAALAAIAIASITFGAFHYLNPHENSDLQALACTVSGVFLGVVFAQYGFLASFLAHSINNTVCSIYIESVKDRSAT